MKKIIRILGLGLLTALSPAVFAGITIMSEPQRLALVIGNSNYGKDHLRTPDNDARLMAQALRDTGFSVTKLENAKQADMREAIKQFGQQLDENSISVFYYSGLSVSQDGMTYLLPVDVEQADNTKLKEQALDTNSLFEVTKNSGTAFFFLDALPPVPITVRHTNTLAATNAIPGQSLVSDNKGDYSHFVAALNKWLHKPLPADIVLKNVIGDVENASEGLQTPWYSSTLHEAFYFTAPPAIR